MSLSLITKARNSAERDRLNRLLANADVEIRRAFRTFLATSQGEETYRQVYRALSTGDIESALRIVDEHIVTFANVVDRIYVNTASAETAAVAATLGSIAAGIGFDPQNPRAAAAMTANRLNLIRQFTDEQRTATRQALVRQFEITGANPRATARAFVDSIGLTAAQEQAVYNYKRLLETNDTQALSRQLRARSKDRLVMRAISNDKPLTASIIAGMVDAYRRNYLQYRAETIARTESTRVANKARQDANQQVIDGLGIDPARVTRVWNATSDARTRDWHADMDGQEVGMDEPFVDGNGNQLMYPGDPNAPAETTINCRCTFSLRIKPSSIQEVESAPVTIES